MGIIHLILGKANPEKMNGVNKVVYNIATKQSESNISVEVWGISENTEVNYPERSFTTKIFKRNRNPFSIPENLKKEILKTDTSMFFHLHGGWIPVFASLSTFLKKHNFKYIITPHGAYNAVAMQKSIVIKKIYFELFEKKVIKNTSKIHCIGESEVDGLQTIFPNNKSILIPYGFEKLKEDFHVNSDKKQIIFGFVGRLDIHTKGLDLLVKSFASFSKIHSDSKFWIIGDGNEKKYLQRLIELNKVTDKIELLGSKFGQEKNNLIKKMDVFVHPSRNEGLPVSVIEAANFAKPCIVTKNTNIGYLIDKYSAGINIPFPDVKLLEQAFNEMYKIWKDENQYVKICKNAVQMVEESFDWYKILQQMNTQLYI
ncbi:TPA: glycosyltransferase family 4 protein [Elizabethkingia meningoseptica]|uniref:glycosyltransferase family 4 protein n=1 Tax=Elizabethkingia meningoseptica TaxID=238 RepID=UPI0022F16F6B|nr:glycosyltransferase family 4 protein [Elizabethkingia meningoseptica]EJK5329677.1 glycosyltransferase family 4 protein [Elizabethkingia meningoseptica]WBS75522.1 glycosyltransferase family 4 protein [Elizabethkingia meningoseptica]HAY3563260.1 glycosyltransferase family 4 protein [Elizabethkingia meningoseptica]